MLKKNNIAEKIAGLEIDHDLKTEVLSYWQSIQKQSDAIAKLKKYLLQIIASASVGLTKELLAEPLTQDAALEAVENYLE
ncbi:MAG: hypothetical protein JW816_02375 [Candidatus Buchananbacteria bacterium]|nr:hypothetical protein [Candidatus Buchananbacteria bacterium]